MMRIFALRASSSSLPFQLRARRAHFLEAGGDDDGALDAGVAALADDARDAGGRVTMTARSTCSGTAAMLG